MMDSRKTPTTLYRLFDIDDRLLYVGISASKLRTARFAQHAREKDWWRHVNSIRLEHISNREEALVLETNAIKKEAPIYNIASNPHRGLEPHPLVLDEPDHDKWIFYSLKSGLRREIDLFLYPEPDFLSCLDDVYYKGIDGQEELEYYAKYLEQRNVLNDNIKFSWYVASADENGFFEPAPQFLSENIIDRDFLKSFTTPQNSNSENIDWFGLPVKGVRFRTFWDAVGWLPSPFQKYFPIRSIVTSRWEWF